MHKISFMLPSNNSRSMKSIVSCAYCNMDTTPLTKLDDIPRVAAGIRSDV
jgi:hypothetical protein